MSNIHEGADFEDFLEEDGILTDCQTVATKRVLAFKIEKARKQMGLSKTNMASRMKTSRTSLNRLLDPENSSVTLDTIGRAAKVVGAVISIELSFPKESVTE